ncbi:FAD/NAD(P)-binding domain-containing protein [Stipitochalara longipes BDJ]|nr:FAD/NAD(P)-binding domain-containing protein [Stipitochalara longipes BDJ]
MGQRTEHPHTPILIVGASTLVDASLNTTKWPKMEQIIGRTMEILRILGLADKLRHTKGVLKTDAPWMVLQHTGLGDPFPEFARVDAHPSLEEERKLDYQHNDGTRTSEHHQRCVLDIFEAFLKTEILQNEKVNSYYGMKYLSHTETEDGVVTVCIDNEGNEHEFTSEFLIGCDGAGSRVRRNTGIKLKGGPINIGAYLFGRFWHINIHGVGIILDQDELGTFTIHTFGPHVLQEDVTKYDPKEVIYRVLGGTFGRPFKIKIDEILVYSAWRPNFAIAQSFTSGKGRVILAGDSAHRQPPHGGLGFNLGAHEQLDLAWKLSALVKGYGGPYLLDAYALERKYIVLQNLIHATELASRYTNFTIQYLTTGPQVLDQSNVERERLGALIRTVSMERAADGVEFDRRLVHSPAIVHDIDGGHAPSWNVEKYQPNTAPGNRVPHVWLKNKIGEMSTIDQICHRLTLVCFEPFHLSTSEHIKSLLLSVSAKRNIPLEIVVLKDESHVRSIWEDRDLVLVRPNGFSLWRSQNQINEIFDIVLGFAKANDGTIYSTEPTEADLMAEFVEKMKTVGAEDTEGGMGEVKLVAGFQVEVE